MGAWRGTRRVLNQVNALVRGLRSGNLPPVEEGPPGEVSPIGELRALLAKEMEGGMGKGSGGDQVLERVAAYLKARVAEPLSQALEEDDQALRTWVESVLDAVEDMYFYLEAPQSGSQRVTTNLVDLVGDVTREFSGEMTVRLTVDAPPGPLRVQVDPEPLKDALFLIFHNAGEFGGGEGVEVTLRKTEEAVHILVRDHGPGFSAQALIRALDPFYSTSPSGLGLGLPYARTAVKAQGGELALRNREEGGAEVEIVLPQD